jgi:glycine/D-amino acid oxidase-like deaminating enzyme
MIQHEIDVPLHRLQVQIGATNANRVWRRSARAVNDLAQLVERLEIQCDFERKKTLFLAGDELGKRALKTEADLRGEAGLKAEYLDGATLLREHGIKRTAAIRTWDSASANPAQLTAGLLANAMHNGAGLVEGIEISDFVETEESVILATSSGRLLQAQHVIFATGYEYLTALEHPGHSIVSTWALASKPGLGYPEWLNEYLVWEASDPYIYFRTTPDGRVIGGGEDENGPHAHADEGKMKRKVRAIRKKIRDLVGVDVEEPAFDWAAPFGTTTTGLPFIDSVPGKKRTMTVMGFGGNGITFSMIAAQILAARVLGGCDPDAPLFAFPAG